MRRVATFRRAPMLASLSAAVLLGGCSVGIPGALQGSGAVKSEVRTVTDFTKVEVRHGIKLELTIGTPATVELTAQENLLPITTTTVTNGTLVVDATQNYTASSAITVKVTVSTLTEIALNGGSAGNATGIVAGTLTLNASGGAALTASGTADALTIDASGGGVLDLSALAAKTAAVELTGGAVVNQP